MNIGDLTNLVEKPFAAVSNLINTPNSAGRYRPFYLRNLLDAVQGRKLGDAVGGQVTLITGGSSGIGEAAAKKIAAAGGVVVLVARTWRTSRRSPTRSAVPAGPPTSIRAISPTWTPSPSWPTGCSTIWVASTFW